MKIRPLFTLLALLLCVSLSAQTTAEKASERAKNRAERKANSRVDQKVDGAVDDAFNAVGNLFKKKKKKGEQPTETAPSGEVQPERDATTGLGGLLGGNSGPWEPYTNPISFSVRMEMTEVKKNGKETQSFIDMAVVTNSWGIRIEDEEANEVSRMILNTQDGKTTMITTDKKGKTTGFRMRMPGVQSMAAETANDVVDDYTFEKTGERKVIDGYNCEKVIVTDNKNNITTESWVTNDANINSKDIFSGMMNAFGSSAKKQKGAASSLAGPMEGFPILSITNDGKSTYTTHFRNIKVGDSEMDKSLLDITGVEIQSLGF